MKKPSQLNPFVDLTVHAHRPRGVLSRREAMQWVMGAVAASALPSLSGSAMGQEVGRTVTPQENAKDQIGHTGKGYGVDADLIKIYKPGDCWPLTFTAAQKKCAKALADTIIPADELGPAASELGVVEMIDEWISAPYPIQQADRPMIIDGLAWMDAESRKRFAREFAALTEQQKHAICDDICFMPKAKKEFKTAAKSFARFRSLCSGAYYATPEGWNAIGYVGNVALASFDGPPPEVLQRLGVEQTVK